MTPTTPLLEIQDLHVGFKKRNHTIDIVNGISLTLNKGEILGVVGESGCGKSVTSLSVLRLLASNAVLRGTIRFDGIDLAKLSDKEMTKIRGNQLSMIFQEPMTSLNPLHSIGKQITEPLIRHGKMPKRELKAKAIELLTVVGISRPDEVYYAYPHELSGGMRQRVMIAIAMACTPKLIIADEPTTALDVTIQAQIIDLMKSISSKYGTSFMLITHDLGVVAEICDRVIVMYAGEIVEETDVRTLFKNPQHPYTIGLMKSVPSASETKERLEPIPGSVPAAGEMPEGCRFAPRCRHASEKCSVKPPLIESASKHRTRCWLFAEKEGQYERNFA
ncbi:peptide/nickel transport system ATP-binding protein [Paenibacillus sp. yr247]|uniref:ABC transporter ATP-binding protein n=1 Tax=Paenibacillus sp. yr247 TaxID=1761880 RepID=UPI0008917E33|nr:ABC transporter ATP-binding protein [Paenibacillus sp. yr247]SDN94621.1 peptide/nickel transport system ATP-binding protein [Paenibacillus sp. yr247]